MGRPRPWLVLPRWGWAVWLCWPAPPGRYKPGPPPAAGGGVPILATICGAARGIYIPCPIGQGPGVGYTSPRVICPAAVAALAALLCRGRHITRGRPEIR